MHGFNGIVSVDTFNRANRGKVYIVPESYAVAKPGDPVEVLYNYSPWGRVKRMRENPKYPWKCIPCPFCKSELLGSASKGKSGQKFDAYHCGGATKGKRAHPYFRVSKKELEAKVGAYLDKLKFVQGFMDGLELHLLSKYRQREKEILMDSSAISHNVADLKAELASALDAFERAQTDIVRQMMEERITTLDTKIKQAETQRGKIEVNEKSIRAFRHHAEHVMEHPADILISSDDLRSRRALMSLFFVETPNYNEIVNGTPKLQPLFRLSEDFKVNKDHLVTQRGIEPRFDP
jgi:hypothetical protein